MTRIDFYILPESGSTGEHDAEALSKSAVITACKLCDKTSQSGGLCYVFAPETAMADAIDSALWSFRQGSFIGHEKLGEPTTLDATPPFPEVLIGASEPPAQYCNVMINLGVDVPLFFSRFERVLEIVTGDTAARARSRERYKFYRDRGYELATHNL